MIRKAVRWIPAVIWMAVIFLLSHRTGSELDDMLPWVERWFYWLGGFNFGHFVAYFILALLVWHAIGKDTLTAKLSAVAVCFVYGITDEFHQTFVPGRHPDIMDLRNDVIGALAAMILISLPSVKKRLCRKSAA